MVQDVLKYLLTSKAATVVVLLVLLGTTGYSFAATEQGDYFYLQETSAEDSRSSCAQVFADIRSGKEEDVGGIVRSLKTINVTYLLDDYDNVLTTDRRKKNYLTYEELMAEVMANKRESYCRIELALYMKNDDTLAGPVYGDLLDDAFATLEDVYASAMASLNKGDLDRAMYAFDLIAPYSDSYEMYLQASEKRKEKSAEKIASIPEATKVIQAAKNIVAAGEIGPIASAIEAGQFSETVLGVSAPGPISLAARIGPVTRAVNAMVTDKPLDSTSAQVD